MQVEMICFALYTTIWAFLLYVLTPWSAAAVPNDLSHPVESSSDGPATTGAATHHGSGFSETPDRTGAEVANSPDAPTEKPATATTTAATVFPVALASNFLRHEGADIGSFLDADPPALWLNSLESFRCVKQSSTEPGTSACDGPDAWESASDGSRGVYFLAVGDTGELSDALKQVAASMADVSSVVPVSFVSLLGDNFYPDGVKNVEDPMFASHFEIPFGHPALQRVPAQVRWRFPNPWYFSRFVYKNVYRDLSAFPVVSSVKQLQRLQPAETEAGQGAYARGRSMTVVNIHLDSNILLSSHHSASKQMAFLEAVLQSAAAEADWIFVHQHHPLFTDGTLCRNIKSFQNLLLPLYLRYGVDAVFAGHEHLLSYFELDGPDSVGGSVAQVISGSGSKLHHSSPTCCTPSLVNKCKEEQGLCRSSNCSFQQATSGFALANLTAKELRLLFIEASTGDVIYQATRRSKKHARMLSRVKYAGSDSMPTAAAAALERDSGAVGYPRISREPIPLELTGWSWPTDDVPLWGHVMVVLLILLFIVLAFVCCWRFSCNLKPWAAPQARRYSLPTWTPRRQQEEQANPHETPTILGSVRGATIGQEVELSSRDTSVSVGPLPVVETTRACELRRQKEQEEMPLV
ncbi:serine/threonine protein phosphatase, putative [Eimeria brunetti]|uniref:Serine/threonine protein phosphatase, putative n=1 Tax=Eimeria brunetti TaxID=51314 RepID=U6LUP5_9EIME|nr:serine/threonine protein phosphatase, putative [Eimeria brunetti]